MSLTRAWNRLTDLSLVGWLLLVLSPSAAVGQGMTTGLLGEGKPWAIRYYIKSSGVDGPTVMITGGIHGNEPAGARAAEQIRHWPIGRGKVIVVPRVNRHGLTENTRYIPKAAGKQKDLNRNFPHPGGEDEPRGEIASALWRFVVEQDPDWVFDLHEGFEFHVSHQPKDGQKRSVGSSIIYDQSQRLDSLVERMLAAANDRVTNPQRRLVPLRRGPKKSTLASAAIHVLGAKSLILETTFQHQRMQIRTRQHRAMMNVAFTHLGMIENDCVNVLTPSRSERKGRVYVALYDDTGGSERGVKNLTRALDSASDIGVAHLGATDFRADVLSQFDVVVFGGGSGSKEAAAIGKDGAEAVRTFVRNGGGYVGVCAGAYLCSAHYSWSLKLIDTHVFTGRREVEGVGPKQMWYRGKFSGQKMQLTEEGRRIFPDIPEHMVVQYQNGPIVSPQHLAGLESYTPLAYFRSEKVLYAPQKGTMIDTPAIVMSTFGEGRVISISPHPEATKGLESMIATAAKAVAPAGGAVSVLAK